MLLIYVSASQQHQQKSRMLMTAEVTVDSFAWIHSVFILSVQFHLSPRPNE